MKYFFILGNNPALSIAEISAIFDASKGELISEDIFILETDQDINAPEIIKKMGGVIKIGKIEKKTKPKKILDSVKNILDGIDISGKFHFGFSNYNAGNINLKQLGMETKKHLREQNISCRWVTSRDKTLSSVVVEQNKLIRNGIEIVLIKNENEILIGQTLAVQPFKELSKRDYGRPGRDDHSGMLPPKLAQIMINLSGAKKNETLLDPFCGSGTVLTESMLMGFRNLIGADNSPRAIQDTEENINWISKKYELSDINFEFYETGAENIAKFIQPNSVDFIVTEPYLGPQRGKLEIKKTADKLADLYSKSLKEFKKILKPNGRIVMIFPVFFNKEFINPDLSGYQIINPIPKNILQNNLIKLTKRNTIVYGRPGQKVWREIVILKLNDKATLKK